MSNHTNPPPGPFPEGLDALLDHVAANLPPSYNVLMEVAFERIRQDAQWGRQDHPDGTGNKTQQDHAKFARKWCDDAFGAGYGTWDDILTKAVAGAEGERDRARLRAELLKVAAVAVAWIEALDRRTDTAVNTSRPILPAVTGNVADATPGEGL